VLDLSPFPYLGLLLIKKGIAKFMAHTCHNIGIISKLAREARIQFVDDVSQIGEEQKFGIMVVCPVSNQGELHQETLLNIPVLR